jgi:hypothetical protein
MVVLGVALAALVSVPAIAQAATDAGPAEHAHGGHAKFPMTAAEFKTKVDSRLAKAREHMEKEAATLPADKAREKRAEFERGVVRVNQEVGRVGADGKVTKEEAKEVRKVARESKVGGRHHGGRGRHHKDGDAAKRGDGGPKQ